MPYYSSSALADSSCRGGKKGRSFSSSNGDRNTNCAVCIFFVGLLANSERMRFNYPYAHMFAPHNDALHHLISLYCFNLVRTYFAVDCALVN